MSSMNFPEFDNAQVIPAEKVLSKQDIELLEQFTAKIEDLMDREELLTMPDTAQLTPAKAQLLTPYLDEPRMSVEKIEFLASDEFPEKLLRTLVESDEFGAILRATPALLREMVGWTQNGPEVLTQQVESDGKPLLDIYNFGWEELRQEAGFEELHYSKQFALAELRLYQARPLIPHASNPQLTADKIRILGSFPDPLLKALCEDESELIKALQADREEFKKIPENWKGETERITLGTRARTDSVLKKDPESRR